MKKTVAVLLCLALVFAFCSCKSSSRDLKTIKESGKLIIGTEGTWSPWTYHDADDNLTGFDVELARLVAEKLGVEAEFEEAGFDSLLAGIDSGRFDTAFNGIGITEERSEKYYFTKPYVIMGTVLVVSSDNSDINDFTDLKGKTTANTASSTYAQIAESYGASVTPVDSLADTINLLTDGRIDATVNSAAVIADYLAVHPDAKIKIAASSDTDSESCCIPLPKTEDGKEICEAIDAALDELRAEGRLSELSIKFFGADYTGSN